MKKVTIILALAFALAGCSSEAPKPEEKAAEPAVEKEATPEPPEPPKEADNKVEPAAVKPATPPAAETKPAPKAADTPAKSNLKPGLYARFETNMGNFTAELNEKEAPGTVANFAALADGTKEWTDPATNTKVKKPYYDGLIFHRVIDGFMIQGGDPLGSGMGGPGFTIKDERNNLKHDKAGVLAMARTGLPDSAGSQFYITVVPTPFLDGQNPPYVVFGQVVEGLDNVLKIGKVRTGANDKPVEPVTIRKIRTERVK
ncbi:MAG TPA: peptidylprolyl isomerase [Terriglobia bacterium]|nr:peptidylprolyl isomerase [Terriglobia bacterium]